MHSLARCAIISGMSISPSATGSDLPPIAWLRAFDAAGRHATFKAAADYLRVTPSTISHQIAALEGYLGVALFDRQRAGPGLTPQGADLLIDVAEGFAKLRAATQHMRQRGQPAVVRISANPYFAGEVLVPLLHELEGAVLDCAISLSATEALQDPRDNEVDICVRTGEGSWPGLEIEKLFPMCAFPVVAAADVRPKPPRIGYRFRGEDVWRSWQLRGGNAVGDAASVRGFGTYSAALRACAEGLGVTLALWPVVAAWVAQGRLRRFDDSPAVPIGAAYLLSRPLTASQRRLRDVRQLLRDMLIERYADQPLPKPG